MLLAELASAKETETCSGLSTVCQPLEEAVLTADHTTECSVCLRAARRAELKGKRGVGATRVGRKLGGQGRWLHEDTHIPLTLIFFFLGNIPREYFFVSTSFIFSVNHRVWS